MGEIRTRERRAVACGAAFDTTASENGTAYCKVQEAVEAPFEVAGWRHRSRAPMSWGLAYSLTALTRL